MAQQPKPKLYPMHPLSQQQLSPTQPSDSMQGNSKYPPSAVPRETTTAAADNQAPTKLPPVVATNGGVMASAAGGNSIPAPSGQPQFAVPVETTRYHQEQVAFVEPWPGPDMFAEIGTVRSPLSFSPNSASLGITRMLNALSMPEQVVLWSSEFFEFRTRPRLPTDPPVSPTCDVYVRRLRSMNSPLLSKLVKTCGIRCRACRHVSGDPILYQPGSAHFLRDLYPAAVEASLSHLKKHILQCQYSDHLTKAKISYSSPITTELVNYEAIAYQQYLTFWVTETLQFLKARNGAVQHSYGSPPLVGWSAPEGNRRVPSVPVVQPVKGQLTVTAQKTNIPAPVPAPPQPESSDLHEFELKDIIIRAVTYHDATQLLKIHPHHGRSIGPTSLLLFPPTDNVESPFVVMMLTRLEMVQRLVQEIQHQPKKPRLANASVTEICLRCRCCKGLNQDNGQAGFVNLSQFIGRTDASLTEGPLQVYSLGYHHLTSCSKVPFEMKRRMMLYRPDEGSENFDKDVQDVASHFKTWLKWISEDVLPLHLSKKQGTPCPPRKDVQMWVPLTTYAETPRIKAVNKSQTPVEQNGASLKDCGDVEIVETPVPPLIGPDDVFVDGSYKKHEGNRRFWVLVARWRFPFFYATESQQLAIVYQIINDILQQGGRFLVVGEAEPQIIPDNELIQRITTAIHEGYFTSTRATRPTTNQDLKTPGSGVLELESAPFQELVFGGVSQNRSAQQD